MRQRNTPTVRDHATDDGIGQMKMKTRIIAYLVCVLVAFVLWIMVMNAIDASAKIADGVPGSEPAEAENMTDCV